MLACSPEDLALPHLILVARSRALEVKLVTGKVNQFCFQLFWSLFSPSLLEIRGDVIRCWPLHLCMYMYMYMHMHMYVHVANHYRHNLELHA